MSTPVLECKNVCYSYHNLNGETKALSDLSFRIDRGEFVAIVGPSGCGKSTLLSLISGLLMPQSGEILLDKETSAGLATCCSRITYLSGAASGKYPAWT